MPTDVDARYQQTLTELGIRKRWYQTSDDLYYAAVVGAVEGVTSAAILTRTSQLEDLLRPTHDLHYIRQTLAAVTAARQLDLARVVEAVDTVAESLRQSSRSKRLRRIAGAIVATTTDGGFEVVANRVGTLHTAWNQRHRLLTNALDLTLAAISDAVGLDQNTALDRADQAVGQLEEAGYKNERHVARILALNEPAASTDRFLSLAAERRGWRRKPLTDHRHLLAIAALADHTPGELIDLVSSRLESLRINRFRPDHRTRLTLATLLTMGASVPDKHPLRRAFHGFAMREHYVNSYADATSG